MPGATFGASTATQGAQRCSRGPSRPGRPTTGGIPSSSDRFWRSHLATGFALLTGEAAAAMAYSAMSRGMHHEVLLRITSILAALGVLGWARSGWLAERRWRSSFVLVFSVGSVACLAVCGHLDGGLDSPFLFLVVLPIVYSATLLAPWGVVVSTVAGLAGVVVVGVTDPDIRLPRENILMFSALVLGSGVFAVTSAVYRTRLEADTTGLILRLQRLAVTDSLTGCANQHRFHDSLRTEVARALRHDRPLSLLVCDVDLFKTYNDLYGHERGDAALAVVGERLRRAARDSDSVGVGRIGGDEFAVLLPETDQASAAELANRIVRDCPAGEPTLSIGVAQLSADIASPSSLFQAADGAMYEAKAEGRNRVSTSHGVQDHARRGWEAAADDRRVDEIVRQERRQRVEMEMVLGLLLDEAPVGFAFVDPDFRILRANRTIVQYSGTGYDDHVGRTVPEVVPHLWAQLEPHLHQVLQEGIPVRNLEIRPPDADGNTAAATQLGSFYPIVVGKRTLGIGIVIVDITDRTRAEQAQELLTDAVVSTLAAAAEARDPYTAGHQRRVARMTGKIATAMGCDPCTIKAMSLAAAIHDIGKIAIPSEILCRPGRLSESEMALVRGHVRAGYDLVSRVDFPLPVAEMILQHHERLDGSGYPQALRGDQIGLGARVIAVADVVEAMSAHRPYRPARGLESALDHVVAGRGLLFDPDVVDICVALFRKGELTLDEGPCSLDCACERHLVG